MQDTLSGITLRRALWTAALIATGYAATLIHGLERYMPRGIAIAVVYAVLLPAITVVVIVVVPAAVTQAQTFLEATPLQIDHLQSSLDVSSLTCRAVRLVDGRPGNHYDFLPRGICRRRTFRYDRARTRHSGRSDD